jgi:hypothetical protein
MKLNSLISWPYPSILEYYLYSFLTLSRDLHCSFLVSLLTLVLRHNQVNRWRLEQQNLKALDKLRPAEEPASVTLIISKLGYDGIPLGNPYQIEKYEDFANRPFDELYNYMSTPKYKLDRSAKDSLEDSHIR